MPRNDIQVIEAFEASQQVVFVPRTNNETRAGSSKSRSTAFPTTQLALSLSRSVFVVHEALVQTLVAARSNTISHWSTSSNVLITYYKLKALLTISPIIFYHSSLLYHLTIYTSNITRALLLPICLLYSIKISQLKHPHRNLHHYHHSRRPTQSQNHLTDLDL